MVTQYEMHGVEDLGLLKMDFLGLRNLDVMEIALDLIDALHRRAARHRQRRRSTTRRPSTCCRRADTMGVFQLEGGPDARAAALARAQHVRRRRGRDRAVPAGPDGAELAQRVRRPQERPQAGHVRPPRPRGDPRPHLRADDLPRAADACRRRSWPATRSKRPTTSARPPARRSASSIAKERGKFVEGCVANGHTGEFARALLRHHRAVRRLLVQQVAQRRLRLHHVPNRVVEGEPPGAVPRGVAHEREEQPRQGRGLPQRLPPAGHRGARPRRQRVGRRLRVRARRRSKATRTRSASGCPRCATSARASSSSSSPRAKRAVRSSTSTTSASASTRPCSTSARSSR